MNKFVFFGSSEFSVYVLDALLPALPLAVVTFPDKPQGRSLVLTPNVVKVWAEKHSVDVIEVTSFKNQQFLDKLHSIDADVFIVASFGKIIPADIIYMPKAKTLNVHPSLLPKLRGPAPIQGAILGESETGVTIMRLNEKMDEGPIVIQKTVEFSEWPVGYKEAEKTLGEAGGKLLGAILSDWISGDIRETEQVRSLATYTVKVEKSDADISNDSPVMAYRKILAYEVWPRARKGQLIITKAHLENTELIIDRVVPSGKKEMSYEDYLRGNSI